MKTKLPLAFLLTGLLLVGAAIARADEEQDLIATLQSNAGVVQKCAACQRLRIVGTPKAVPALAALLTGERTAHAARYALEGMPFPEAGEALRQAFAKSTGDIKAGLADSLGWRRDASAVPLLVPLLDDPDPVLMAAAASSLGKIGGKPAVASLSKARDHAPGAVQVIIGEGLLQCAERSQSGGDTAGAMVLYRDLLTAKSPDQIHVAAWRGLVMTDVRRRADLIMKALGGTDRTLQNAALKVIRELADPAVITTCVKAWPKLSASAQLAVLDAHRKLGAAALTTARAATQSQYASVREAAWQAMGDLGDAAIVPALTKAAASADGTEREAARDALARLRAEGVQEALVRHLAAADAPQKVEVLRALGERGDPAGSAVLLQNAGTGTGAVRLAALESLRKLARPETTNPLLNLAAKAASEAESEPVLQALYAVIQNSGDKNQTTRGILAAMGAFSTAERRQVLPLLAELGTTEALSAAMAATKDPDAEMVKQAVRVLSRWPNAAPAARLLEVADSNTGLALQVLALRGGIEVLNLEPDANQRLPLLQKALAIARRPEEKKQALGQMGLIPNAAALEAVMAALADPALAGEAGLAAMMIAEKLAPKDPELAKATAAKVLAQCKTPDIVKRAWAIRGKAAGAGPFLQDWVVAGPFSQPGVVGAMGVYNVAFAPEKAGQKVNWKPLPKGDTHELLGVLGDQANCAAYAKTVIVAPADTEAVLLSGSDDGLKAWLNGEVVLNSNVDRGMVADQDMAPIQLKKGANELLLKITQGGGGWAFCARVVNAEGQPIVGLKTQAPAKP